MDFGKICLTAAGHIRAAKLLRLKAAAAIGNERERRLTCSNTLVICARLACGSGGDILDLTGFEYKSLDPDWSVIDVQVARFELPRVEAPSIMPML